MTPRLRLQPESVGIGMTSQRVRDRLVERLREAGIQDESTLNAMRTVPRHLFIDEALASRAYEDTALPIGHGVLAHSDGDVVLHALCDAMLGALALGDIGRHFPPSDARWKDADSAQFLQHCDGLLRERGWRVGNADITVICERPKVGPHAVAMRERIADLLAIELDAVSVKATTSEQLGFTGRGEGIAAQAAVLLGRIAAPHQ